MKTSLHIAFSILFPLVLMGQTGYVQEGKASFYADKFEGRATASGERFSHSKSTCAHLSLPFGTLVRVTNLANGQNIVLRVNDRGPFVPDRIIDITQSAAEKLGFLSDGIAQVKIEVLDDSGMVAEQPAAPATPAEKPQPQPIVLSESKDQPQVTPQSQTPALSPDASGSKGQPQPVVLSQPKDQPQDYELYELKVSKQERGGFTVQVGSYKELVNLLRIADDLKKSLKKEVRVQVTTVNGEKVYRLMVGEFADRRDAEIFKSKAAEIYPDCFVVELK